MSHFYCTTITYMQNRVIFIIKDFHLYCYLHNVLADMSSGLYQVFIELGNLHGTSKFVLYWIHGGRLFWFL